MNHQVHKLSCCKWWFYDDSWSQKSLNLSAEVFPNLSLYLYSFLALRETPRHLFLSKHFTKWQGFKHCRKELCEHLVCAIKPPCCNIVSLCVSTRIFIVLLYIIKNERSVNVDWMHQIFRRVHKDWQLCTQALSCRIMCQTICHNLYPFSILRICYFKLTLLNTLWKEWSVAAWSNI